MFKRYLAVTTLTISTLGLFSNVTFAESEKHIYKSEIDVHSHFGERAFGYVRFLNGDSFLIEIEDLDPKEGEVAEEHAHLSLIHIPDVHIAEASYSVSNSAELKDAHRNLTNKNIASAAKKLMRKLCLRKRVELYNIHFHDHTNYADILCDSKDIGNELLINGYAVVKIDSENNDEANLALIKEKMALQEKAKKAKVGIWE